MLQSKTLLMSFHSPSLFLSSMAFSSITSFSWTSSSSSSVPSSSYASWPWPFIHSTGHKAYRQLYRRSPLSNLQKLNWKADGLGFVCHFISSPKSTSNNAWRREGALISSIYQCAQWARSGWRVKGERVELSGFWLFLNFLHRKLVNEARPDLKKKSIFSKLCLIFHPNLSRTVFIFFQRNCPVLRTYILPERNSRDYLQIWDCFRKLCEYCFALIL